MTTLVIPNAVQVTVQMTNSTRTVDNVLGFEVAPGFLPTDLPTLLNAVKTAWEATGGPLTKHATVTTMQKYRAVDLRSTTGAVAELASTAGGAISGGISTMASCALITYGGGTRNRTGSGRLYHGPLAASQVNTDGRTVPAAGITALLAAYNQFDAAMNTAGYQWVVLSRKDLLVHPISSINVSNIIATQRRRMRS